MGTEMWKCVRHDAPPKRRIKNCLEKSAHQGSFLRSTKVA